jgi:hypothetical protein
MVVVLVVLNSLSKSVQKEFFMSGAENDKPTGRWKGHSKIQRGIDPLHRQIRTEISIVICRCFIDSAKTVNCTSRSIVILSRRDDTSLNIDVLYSLGRLVRGIRHE